uniref:Uncharacterized protein n=1 Tax=Anguilla anguilla TaxID=7936 RepID=A0A0E9W040_ANGAN
MLFIYYQLPPPRLGKIHFLPLGQESSISSLSTAQIPGLLFPTRENRLPV